MSAIEIYGGGKFYGSSIRNYSAYCSGCEMLFRHSSGYAGGDDCPNDGCSEMLTDANEQQDLWDAFQGR